MIKSKQTEWQVCKLSEVYEVKKVDKIITDKKITVVVPGSKSITNRALLLAAVAEGKSVLKGCMTSDDAMHFLNCIKELGFPVEVVGDGGLGNNITIQGFGGDIPNKRAEICVGSAGTAARFLAAMLAFSAGDYILNSSDQMKKRPMKPLIDTLRQAGAKVECLEEEGYFPLHIIGIQNKQEIPTEISVNIDKSSQFLSALLIAAGTIGKETKIRVKGSHGLSYVDMTAEMMKSFGVSVDKLSDSGEIEYIISGDNGYRAQVYEVEPDMSAAAYFYGLGAILGAEIAVKGITGPMLQGDMAFLDVLKKMGCHVSEEVVVKGPIKGQLTGDFSVDMSAFSDQALTLAAIAPFATGPVSITGISHIRLQECDRIKAMVDNLTAMGIKVEEKEDGVIVYPGNPKGCCVETFDDHRVAMSFALTGLRSEGIKILNPSCCKKTFAEYFHVLEDTLRELTQGE